MNEEKNELPLFPEEIVTPDDQLLPIDLIDGPLVGDEPGADLVASIERIGIMFPVIVQRRAKGKESFTIVDGRRRMKAAHKLGLTHVPARIIPHDVANPEAYTLQANMARRANPVSEFHAIRDLIARGYSEKEITKTLSIKPATLRQRLELGKLIEVLLELLETGRIAVSVGEAAAKLTKAEQEQLVDIFAQDDKLTLKHVEELKRVKRDERAQSLSDVLFGDGEKRQADARAAISHLDAAEQLLTALGIEVDFTELRAKVES